MSTYKDTKDMMEERNKENHWNWALKRKLVTCTTG